MATNQDIGKLGEELATHALKVHGYEILERNWRSPFGEVDLIAVDSDTLVFVEVKTRAGTRLGLPEEAVDHSKAERIHDVAMSYFDWEEIHPIPNWRIDVVAILLTKQHKVSRLNLYKNAFIFDE